MKFLQRILLEIFRWPIITIWHMTGWRVNIDKLEDKKLIIAAAPHTSNWDYLYFLLAGLYLRRRLMVTAKHTLFRFPIGWFVRLAGGIPIERSKSHNMVQQMVDLINERDEIILVFTPEGTRSYRPYWRSGFYWTAAEAGVDIVLGMPHYDKKEVYLDYRLTPSGDFAADLEKFKEQLLTRSKGLYPEKTNDIKPRPEDPQPLEQPQSSENDDEPIEAAS